MALYRQKRSPYWWASYAGADGKRVWESTGLTGKRPAAEWLEKKKLDVMRQRAEMEDRRRRGEHEPATLAEIAERIKRDHFPNSLKRPRYLAMETRRLDLVVKWFGGMTLVRDIRPARIAEYRADLLRNPPTGRPIGKGGANSYLITLSIVLHRAAEWEFIDAAPTVPKFPKEKLNIRLTRAHADRLIAFAAGRPCLQNAIRFAAGTGCRLGEQEALRWGEIDMETGTITFRDTKNGEARTIGMLPDVRQLLEELRAGLPVPVPADANVLRSAEGKAWRLASACERQHLAKLIERAGVPAETTWHHFRHMFATWARTQGWPRDTIKAWMGHKSEEAAAFYSHVSTQELLDAAAGKFDRMPAKLCDTGVILARQSS